MAVSSLPGKYGIGDFGLDIVERVPMEIEPQPYDIDYLKTKKKKMGHVLKNV